MKGTTEGKMIGWHHQLNGRGFEQALGVVDGQGSLACCSPWVCKVSDTTEQLNRTELIHVSVNMLSPFDYCKWMYKYLFDILLSVLLDICPEVGLLDCMVAIFLVF